MLTSTAPNEPPLKAAAICMLLALVISPPVFSGQTCVQNRDDLKDYLAYQKRTGTGVVYAECKQPRGKSLLILRVDSATAPSGNHAAESDGNESGLLVQQLIGACASNTALVSVSSTGVDLGETAGGVETMQISDGLLQELSLYPFRFVPSRRLEQIFTSMPARRCRHSYRGWGNY